MKVIIKITVTFFLVHIILISGKVHGQENTYPEIGKLMPAFALKTDTRNKESRITSESLKGKNYILDFWTIGCSGCVASFPKMDSLQRVHLSDLQIILVGLEQVQRDVQKVYDVYRKKYKLELTSIYDSCAYNRFVPSGVPHLIWVDGEGVVKAITKTDDANEENIRKFLANEDFNFEDVSFNAIRMADFSYVRDRPLLINGNGGDDSDYVYRSIIAMWKPGMGNPDYPGISAMNVDGRIARYQIVAASLDILFATAYFGGINSINRSFPNTYPIPQFTEGAKKYLKRRFDSTPRFSYSIELPLVTATTKTVMRKMQDDLATFFGLSAGLVQKSMPCYKLVVIDDSKFSRIAADSGKPMLTWEAERKSQRFVNMPIQRLIDCIPSRLIPYNYLNIVNETGYTSNLTFELRAHIYDLESIRSGLNEVGLDLVATNREMVVLEITEDHF